MNKFRDILGFSPTCNIGRYLGFPIFTRKVKKVDFGFILDRMTSKLTDWKANLLGRARRVVLASSVLNSIPNYVI